ncbi:hypothetical protein [Saccharomonospora cyanea]|nr:hypothetical protein [Saccharomonospora cyanea]
MDENRRSMPDATSDAALDEALRKLHHEMRADQPRLDDARARVLAAARAESKRRPRRAPVRAGVSRLPFRRWGPVVAAAASVAAAVVVPLAMLSGDTGAVGPAGQAPEQTATAPELTAQDVLSQAAETAESKREYDRPVTFPFLTSQREFVPHLVEGEEGDTFVVGQERLREAWSDDGRVWKLRQHVTSAPEWLGHESDSEPAPVEHAFTGTLCGSTNEPGTGPCVDDEHWYRPQVYSGLVGEEQPLRKLNSMLPEPDETPWRIGGAGNDRADDVFDTAIRALRTEMVPAEVRAAMYRELAELPGIHVTDESVTMRTRMNDIVLENNTGVAVGIDDPDSGQRREIILNLDTGWFVGARAVALDGNELGVASGTVLWSLAPEVAHEPLADEFTAPSCEGKDCRTTSGPIVKTRIEETR